MAMAGLPDDYNEDDFEEFNPHPYLGGYDIVKTYGAPLPPSPAICYPISSSASSPPVASPPVVKVSSSSNGGPVKEAKDESKSVPVPVSKPAITPVVEQPWFEPYEYGEPYQPEPYKPDIFRSWSFSIPQNCCRHRNGRVRDFDYWNHMMRGLDFLFGHAQGYGERRVGTDVYGIPIYANKKTPTESVTVHVEQPPVQKLEYHLSSAVQVHPNGLDWPSWNEERKEEKNENYWNSYQSEDYYSYEQHTSNWDFDSSYHDNYDDEKYNNLGYSSTVEGERIEENNWFSTPMYSYNKHYHEQPLHVQIETTDQTWTQMMVSYEAYGNNHSSYDEEGEEIHPNISSHGDESVRYGHIQYEHLEPFKPSWSQNMGYYGEYLGGAMVRSEDYSTFYSDEGNATRSSGYNEGNIYYVQNQPSWPTGDGHVLYGEDVSNKTSWDDEPRNWVDAIFGPSRSYYACEN